MLSVTYYPNPKQVSNNAQLRYIGKTPFYSLRPMRKAWLRRNSQARLKNAQTLPYAAASDNTSTGTLLDSYVPPPFAGPFAEVGRQTFDGKGNTNATATLSANGNTRAAWSRALDLARELGDTQI
jgi:hypothetical protein